MIATGSHAPKVCIFLHHAEYDLFHQGLSIAATAVAHGRPVDLFFFWWALERLLDDRLDEPDLTRTDINEVLERRNVPSLRALLQIVREDKLATIIACSGSFNALGRTPHDLDQKVDLLMGWSGILDRTRDVVDRFFL